MPVPFTSNDPAAVVLGPFSQLMLEAPDDSCKWNGFPITVKVAPYIGQAGVGEVTVRQLSNYLVPIPGGGSPSAAQWPHAFLDNPADMIRAGNVIEFDLLIRADGAGTARVSQQYNGLVFAQNISSGFNSFSGVAATSNPTCAQIGCPNGPMEFVTAFTPFNPLINITVGNGILTVRWVGGGSPVGFGDYIACEDFFIGWAPPACGAASTTLDGFGRDDFASPPSSDWTNSIVVGDGGLQDNGPFPDHGCVPVGSYGTAWWNARQFGPEQEAWFIETPPAVPTGTESVWLFVGLEGPGTAGVNGYALQGTETDVTLYRLDAGSLTTLDTFTLPTPLSGIPDGTAWGFKLQRAAGGLIIASYTNPASSAPSVFQMVGFANDTTYEGVGYIGLGIDSGTGVVREFGGGDIASNEPGLTIILETDECGNISTTYDDVKSIIDVMNVAGTMPLIATVLGTHHGEPMTPQNASLEGAVCSGTVGSTPGG